jgi:CRISPR-associated exonuclease Cas4
VPDSDLVAASALGRAVYCPRQLYYARTNDDSSPPAEVRNRRKLAFRYPTLQDSADETLQSLPLAVEPASFRENLAHLTERPDWESLIDPADRHRMLTGKDVRGVAHKLLEEGDGPPTPVLVSGGVPPPEGVWEPQAIRAVALAKALAWERGREVPRALVEYPAVGRIRSVRVTTRRAARYREALRTVRTLDGPPSRLDNDAKCAACDYQEQCGVKSRSLRSLFGL